MRIGEVLHEAVRLLRSSGVPSAAMAARVLLADALGRDHAWLEAHSEDSTGAAVLRRYRSMLRDRAAGVPLQYIRGTQEFYGIEFTVSPAVLIPRPETEHLVEAALDRIRPGHLVADIGTGSGAIAVSLALNAPPATVVASDVSREALRIAKGNAERLGAKVQFFAADAALALARSRVDMVVTNPPYVPTGDAGGLQRELAHEPPVALFGGKTGLEVFGRIAESAFSALKPRGWFLSEIGFCSREAVAQLLLGEGWDRPEFLPDLAGIDRVVVTRRAG